MCVYQKCRPEAGVTGSPANLSRHSPPRSCNAPLAPAVLICQDCHKEIPQAGQLNNRNLCFFFLTVLEAGSASSRGQQGRFILRPLSFACRCPPCSPFSRVFRCGHEHLWYLCPNIFFQDTSQTGSESILTVSLYFNYLFKGLISKYSPTLGD